MTTLASRRRQREGSMDTNEPAAGRSHRMTLGVYRVDENGKRVEVTPPRKVSGSWLDTPARGGYPPCRCPRCREA